jgi:hypothetical protein
MKNVKIFLAIAVVSAILLQLSCSKELPPVGLILTNPLSFTDTSYTVSPVPSAQPKAVFVEEMTGVMCANCPAGGAILKQLQIQNPGRVVVAKLHSNFLANPIKPTDPDLRTPDAEAIDVGFASSGQKPNAVIDRTINTLDPPGTAQYYANKGKWAQVVTAQLAKTTPVNIDLVSSVDTLANEIKLKSTFTFTQTHNGNLAFTIYLLEDEVEATQDTFTTTTVEIEGYIHEEVLRKSITQPISGTALPAAPYNAGQVYARSVAFPIPSNVLNKKHMRITLAVHGVNKGEVLHAATIKL